MKLDRRTFLKAAAALGAAVGRPPGAAVPPAAAQPSTPSGAAAGDDEGYYVVVASGAGGGTVAARLAEVGYRVVLLEAGADPMQLQGGNAAYPDAARLPDDYQVPCFHALSTENEARKWDFFVRHYADETQQRRDSKYVTEERGVLYPRAGTLGGRTAHNAMMMVYPHTQGWDRSAELALARGRCRAAGSIAPVLRAAGGLPPPAPRPLLRPARDHPEPPRLGRLAVHREGESPRGPHGRSRGAPGG